MNDTRTRLSIILLSYNTAKLTKACVESIIRQYKSELNSGEFEIIVVDNASGDNTVATINNQLSTINKKFITIIENKENYGFAKGNNIAAKKAQGKYLLFLNSDTTIEDHGLLRMTEYLEANNDAGILGGRLENADGTSQPSAGHFYTLVNVFLLLLGAERIGLLRFSPKKAQVVDWVSGASMMVRKTLFDQLGGFDEHFFMYMEDMEFCYRAKLQKVKTYFCPDVKIVHRQLGSSNRAFAISNIYRGTLYFYKKHTDYFQYATVKLLLLAKAYLAIGVGKLTNNVYLTTTYKKALSLAI